MVSKFYFKWSLNTIIFIIVIVLEAISQKYNLLLRCKGKKRLFVTQSQYIFNFRYLKNKSIS